MKWLSVLPQQCLLLMTCLLMALEAVPIDIDKTKVKGEDNIFKKLKNATSSERLEVIEYLRVRTDEVRRELGDIVGNDNPYRGKLGSILERFKTRGVLGLKQLDLVSHYVTTNMDKLPKKQVEILRRLIKLKRDSLPDTGIDHQKPDTFELKDLDMLIIARSKDRLKEVWEEADGLDPNEFDPKTFSKLHDVNNDGFLDEEEFEAQFTKELEKVYDPKNEEDDMVEMEEERLRMREHVMTEEFKQLLV